MFAADISPQKIAYFSFDTIFDKPATLSFNKSLYVGFSGLSSEALANNCDCNSKVDTPVLNINEAIIATSFSSVIIDLRTETQLAPF